MNRDPMAVLEAIMEWHPTRVVEVNRGRVEPKFCPYCGSGYPERKAEAHLYPHQVMCLECGTDLWGIPFGVPWQDKDSEMLKRHVEANLGSLKRVRENP